MARGRRVRVTNPDAGGCATIDRIPRCAGGSAGRAARELNLAALIGRSAEARERRLVPEVIEDFFVQAGPLAGVHPKQTRAGSHLYRVGRVPRNLWPAGERLEPRFGKLGREYKQVVFDKRLLDKEAGAEWVTPGHPLFEVVREDVLERVQDDLAGGTTFYDLHAARPYLLDVFSSAIKDGRGNALHRRLFVVQTGADGPPAIKQPTVFLDLALAPKGVGTPNVDLPDRAALERTLLEKALRPFLDEVARERKRETDTIARHVEISLNEMIHRQQLRMAELVGQQERGEESALLPANLKQAEDRLDELNGRLEGRRADLALEAECKIDDIRHVGRAWVLPHPERATPQMAKMVQDDEIEHIAVDFVTDMLRADGWTVKSVEPENRGFDLLATRSDLDGHLGRVEVRFVEVKGRSGVGEVALTTNEYKTAERLGGDYWLYVVFDCSSKPQAHVVRDPARLAWEPLVKIEHYHVSADKILGAEDR